MAAGAATAQTTQGVIAGRVAGDDDGRGLGGAVVRVTHVESEAERQAGADPSGRYFLAGLSPGTYRVRVESDGFQAQEAHGIKLAVAASLWLDLRLRRLEDVMQRKQSKSVLLPGNTVMVFFGPDVDTSRTTSFDAPDGRRQALEATVSDVADRTAIDRIPLSGRDVYTFLATLPGVTVDTGSGRGLGYSVNGQRPSASSFLLDGVENNNYLVTGPLVVLAPEMVGEYRVSLGGFSAEYGRASGFLANAVTHRGGNEVHGLGYYYMKNQHLHANDFQRNLAGLARRPWKEWQPGFVIGGPLRRDSVFLTGSIEQFRLRSDQDSRTYVFPSASFIAGAAGRVFQRLMREFPVPAAARADDTRGDRVSMDLAAPNELRRSLSTTRLDWNRGPAHQAMVRLSAGSLDRPYLVWSPYEGFSMPLAQRTANLAASWTARKGPTLTNEARFGFTTDLLSYERPHPEFPTISAPVSMPGALPLLGYRNRNTNFELLDNAVAGIGTHIAKFGGGLLIRRLVGQLTAGRDPYITFNNMSALGLDQPSEILLARRRDGGGTPEFSRSYRVQQFHLFAQDAWRVGSRITANYGVRYESFGAPENTGPAKDSLARLSDGIPRASLAGPGVLGNQPYAADRNDVAARLGLSARVSSGIAARIGYGVYYDRPFDNLWLLVRNNNVILEAITNQGSVINRELPGGAVSAFGPDFSSAITQSWFAGIEARVARGWEVYVNVHGSRGTGLVATDIVNRPTAQPGSRFDIPLMRYLSNLADSSYRALGLRARYQGRRFSTHVSYAWSRSIDTQSEPLAGEFFNLSFVGRTGAGSPVSSAFSRTLDPAADRGMSDFDQRHNIVSFGAVELPWRLSASYLASFRTGFPFSVRGGRAIIVPASGGILNNRADLVPGRSGVVDEPIPGGRQLLDRNDFSFPGPVLGGTGRNAFRAPGFYQVDVSLAREFPVRDRFRITLRADAYNLLNHANLNAPDSYLGEVAKRPSFGQASYGRNAKPNNFPAIDPLNEQARQVQLMLRVQF